RLLFAADPGDVQFVSAGTTTVVEKSSDEKQYWVPTSALAAGNIIRIGAAGGPQVALVTQDINDGSTQQIHTDTVQITHQRLDANGLPAAPWDTSARTVVITVRGIDLDDLTTPLVHEEDNLSLKGGSGNDRIVGSRFADAIDSGAGDDVVTGGEGVDVFTDPSGTDAL